MKASDVFMTVAAYQMLAEQTEAPFHLGITEAGGFVGGTVKSAIGLGNLLWAGLGDTLRVSLSADPVEEVKIGFEILKSLGLRHRGVNIISCPVLRAAGLRRDQDRRDAGKAAGTHQDADEPQIIGCVVNGPGEALMTDVGFTGGGAGSGMVYLAGKQSHKMSNDQMVDHIVEQVEKKAEELEAARAAEAQAAE
jgi:(E)-4-hydroxy-3-methylbut-2-enyl-diphosphate synthase